MKTKSLIITLILIANFSFGQEFTDLYGDYLGQSPPGDTAVVFAPGIVSTDLLEHSPAVFSPDGNGLYWWVNCPPDSLNKEWTYWGMHMKRINNRWTVPEKCEFFRGVPFFSKDGNKMYYESPDNSFCIRKKVGNNWGEPVCIMLLEEYPDLKFIGGTTLSSNGALYFMAVSEGLGTRHNIGLYRAKFINGKCSEPELLSRKINLPPFLNWTPYIAPDESYLIFSSHREGEYGNGDLYISFHDVKNDTWSEPVNMGKSVNTWRQERIPSVSPDGKYLFFTRPTPGYSQDVYWVSASIIDRLKDEYNKESKSKINKL